MRYLFIFEDMHKFLTNELSTDDVEAAKMGYVDIVDTLLGKQIDECGEWVLIKMRT